MQAVPARVGTTIAAATVCSVIRVAAEAASKPNVRSGTKDSAVRATAVRTNVDRGRRALRAMTAAMPTPTSEKTSVSCANPAIGMLAPVLSANETPAADATAARTVVATEATTAAATPCFQTGCRSSGRWTDAVVVWVVGICVVVDMSGSASSAGRPVRPAHAPSTNGRVEVQDHDRRRTAEEGSSAHCTTLRRIDASP